MEFNKLKYLLKVADLGNFTRAAQELYMTQPALSHYISKVEREEGVKIFDRSSNPVTLTYEGEFYIDTARKILSLNNQLQEEMTNITANRRGRLTIGIPPTRAAFMLPKFLPEYSRKYPGVQICTVERTSRQLREDIQQGNVDFAVLPFLQGLDAFDKIDLYEEELFLVAREGTLPDDAYSILQNGENVVHFENLKNEKFILLKKGHGMRYAIDVLFDYHGYKTNIIMETTNNETAMGLAVAGMGIAIVPFMTLDPLRSVFPMTICKISEAGMKWLIAAVFRKNSTLSIHARECIELMQSVFKKNES